MDKYKVIIMAADGRQVEKLFDTEQEMWEFFAMAAKASGAKVEHTASYPASPGMPAFDLFEEATCPHGTAHGSACAVCDPETWEHP